MTEIKNVNGRYYPPFHSGWGGFAEELFHYTSRYYFATEAFLRHLAEDDAFVMSGYRAALLSPPQRDLMAAVLSCRPDRQSATAATSIVSAVIRRDGGVEPFWADAYLDRLDRVPKHETLLGHSHVANPVPPAVAPLDPFLNLAERLQLPVAVRDRHVEVCMHTLAEHLSSPNSAVRTNLHNAVLDLHNAGYVLRNHPHLTHSEAHEIGDDDAV